MFEFVKQNLIPKLLLFLSIILTIYVFYKSEIIFDGELREYYLNYYFFCLVIFLLSIVLLIVKKTIQKYINILILSSLFSLYSAELYFSYNNFNSLAQISGYYEKLKKKNSLQLQKNGGFYDMRTKFEVYEELHNNDPNVSVRVSLSSKNLSGLSNKKTLVCNELGYFSSYLSDRFGFNNPDYVHDANEVDFLLIGDSLINGDCVNRPNDISSVIRDISDKSVVGFGYGGMGPLREYAMLKEYFPNNVKNVIWFYSELNDIDDLRKELGETKLVKYLKDDFFIQNLKLKQKQIDKIVKEHILEATISEKDFPEKKKIDEKKIYDEKIRENIIKFIKLYYIRNLFMHKSEDPIPPEFSDIIFKAKEFSNEKQANFYFVYMPSLLRYKQINFSNYYYLNIKKIISDLEINFIDIHEGVFKKEKNPLSLFPFQNRVHYNPEGYEKVAKYVYNEIRMNNN